MDAAQAEKMREREAMENVKLLYHDNMIEMTSVSSSRNWGTHTHKHNTLHNRIVILHDHMSLSFITTHNTILVLHHELCVYHNAMIHELLLVLLRCFPSCSGLGQPE